MIPHGINILSTDFIVKLDRPMGQFSVSIVSTAHNSTLGFSVNEATSMVIQAWFFLTAVFLALSSDSDSLSGRLDIFV